MERRKKREEKQFKPWEKITAPTPEFFLFFCVFSFRLCEHSFFFYFLLLHIFMTSALPP